MSLVAEGWTAKSFVRYVWNVNQLWALNDDLCDMSISNWISLNNWTIQSRVEDSSSDSTVNLALV